MAEKSIVLTDDGQEVEQADVNLLGATAGLADDRILAELLRLAPYDGTNTFKAIFPYSTHSGASTHSIVSPVVQPSGSANGSVIVNPFRAVVGSRNLPSAAPSPASPTGDTNALAAWRDVRSGIFTDSASNLSRTVALAANSSGNPRWDLVYAQITPDAAQNTVTRRVKDPTSGAISTPGVPQYDGSPVTIGVVTGTPGASPALPVVPADAAGNYFIPLAWVRVVNGFSAGSTLQTVDIRSCVLGHDGTTPVSTFSNPSGGDRLRPATGNNDTSGTIQTRAFPWSATSHARPGPFLPPEWKGSDGLIVEVDVSDASSANWSHNDGDIVDASVDWRKRVFQTLAVGSSTRFFANDAAHAGASMLPGPGVGASNYNTQPAHSFVADSIVSGTSALVSGQTQATISDMDASGVVDLYVDMTTGALKIHLSGTPKCRVFFWIQASGAFPNY